MPRKKTEYVPHAPMMANGVAVLEMGEVAPATRRKRVAPPDAPVIEPAVAKPKETPPVTGYVIPRPNMQVIKVPIVGTTSLITHAWDEKAIRIMLEAQTKKARAPKAAKVPEADFQAARYLADEGWDGIPSAAFKAAMVGACRAVDGLPMTVAKRMLFCLADGFSTRQNVELTRIVSKPPRMRRDMVRLETGVADIRFRPEYVDWRAELTVEFNAGIISAEMILNLIDLAGYSEGVCEWRPSAPKSCSGNHGRWTVDRR